MSNNSVNAPGEVVVQPDQVGADPAASPSMITAAFAVAVVKAVADTPV
jgi:hypothetical protein